MVYVWWQNVGRCSSVPVDRRLHACYLFVRLSLFYYNLWASVIIFIMKCYGKDPSDRLVTFNISLSLSLSFSLSLSLSLSCGPHISLFIFFFCDRLSNSYALSLIRIYVHFTYVKYFSMNSELDVNDISLFLARTMLVFLFMIEMFKF